MVKKILICFCSLFMFFSPLTILAQDTTLEINNYINDYADLIGSNTESELNAYGSQLEEETGAQIVFITVDSLDGQDIRQVAYKTFKKYGLGDADKDNGILFIVSMEDKQRYMEVGTGLEGTITDITSQHLQTDYLVPEFQNGNYEEGLKELYYQTAEVIRSGDSGDYVSSKESSISPIIYMSGIFIFVCAIVLILGMGSTAIVLKPGQRYRLKVKGYDFDEGNVIVSVADPSIVSVEGNGWITALKLGTTTIALQKKNKRKVIQVTVTTNRRRNSTADWIILSSMSNSGGYHSHGGGFSSGGGFSGGGGGSRGGGAGGSW